jgi:hypothetical protein
MITGEKKVSDDQGLPWGASIRMAAARKPASTAGRHCQWPGASGSDS